MLKENIHPSSDRELPVSSRISHVKKYKTPAGPLFLRNCCSPSFVQGLKVDEGLRTFARRPEREHQLLLSIAQKPENRLTLAYTATGNIVGQATLAPLDEWWQDIGNAYEIAVEVSSGWRKLGIAHQLLTLALELRTLERMILLAMGLCWHWDTAGLDLSPLRYRGLIAHLFAAHNFVEYLTAEPNIRDDPANILLVRIGNQVDQQTSNQFLSCLFPSNALPGV